MIADLKPNQSNFRVSIDPVSLPGCTPDAEVARLDLCDLPPPSIDAGSEAVQLQIVRSEPQIMLYFGAGEKRVTAALSHIQLQNWISRYEQASRDYSTVILRGGIAALEAADAHRRSVHEAATEWMCSQLPLNISLGLETARGLFTLLDAVGRRIRGGQTAKMAA